ncbi:hypothetical protein LRD17_12955, partial [Halorhodospira halochloris]
LNYAVTQNRSGERAEELTMAVAEEWRQEGRQEGRKEGRQEGRKEGWKEGSQEGQQRGRLEAKASDLLRLIERKFGSQAKRLYKEQVENASLEQLDHWFDRAIDAARVENVFAED